MSVDDVKIMGSLLHERQYLLSIAFALEDFLNDETGSTTSYETLASAFYKWKKEFGIGKDKNGET